MRTLPPGLELIEALRIVVNLEYYAAPHTDSIFRVPIVVWRYDETTKDERIISMLNKGIESAFADQHMQWELRHTGKNWLLAPKKFLELEDSTRFAAYPDILQYLELTSPEYGKAANQDLHEIAEKVMKVASKLRENVG